MDDLDFESLLSMGGLNTDMEYMSQSTSVSSQFETISKGMEGVNESFSAVKEKILSTDNLIRSYQVCKRQLEDTTEKLDQSHKEKNLIQAQLELMLSKEEPSYSENVKLKAEIEKMKMMLDNLKAELHGMDESRRIHEETIKVLKAEGSGVVLEMRKKHKHQMTELQKSLAEKSLENRKLIQSKKQLKRTIAKLRQDKKSKLAHKKGEVETMDIIDQSILNEDILKNNEPVFALPDVTTVPQRIPSMQNGITELETPNEINNLEDSVFQSTHTAETVVRRESLKERIAYITSTTDDSADETQPNKPRNHNFVDNHRPNAEADTHGVTLSATKQKTLKNRMMDIKRKRAYSSFKRCPTQPQLSDLLSLATDWKAFIVKRPLCRKASGVDKLKIMIAEYCEKHYLGNNEKLVLHKFCKLHKTIYSKKHKLWLDEMLQTAVGSDVSSTESKFSSASESETVHRNNEISTEKNIIPQTSNKSDNTRGNVTEKLTDWDIPAKTAPENEASIKQQNDKPALLRNISGDSTDSDRKDEMEVTDITSERTNESSFISEMPDIGVAPYSQIESNEISMEVTVEDTLETLTIETQSSNIESIKSSDISESTLQKELIDSTIRETKNSESVEDFLKNVDDNAPNLIEMDNDITNSQSVTDSNSDGPSVSPLQTEREEKEKQVNIVDSTCQNEIIEDVLDTAEYSISTKSKRVSRIHTDNKTTKKLDDDFPSNSNAGIDNDADLVRKNVSADKKKTSDHSDTQIDSDLSFSIQYKRVSQIESSRKYKLDDKKKTKELLDDATDSHSNSDVPSSVHFKQVSQIDTKKEEFVVNNEMEKDEQIDNACDSTGDFHDISNDLSKPISRIGIKKNMFPANKEKRSKQLDDASDSDSDVSLRNNPEQSKIDTKKKNFASDKIDSDVSSSSLYKPVSRNNTTKKNSAVNKKKTKMVLNKISTDNQSDSDVSSSNYLNPTSPVDQRKEDFPASNKKTVERLEETFDSVENSDFSSSDSISAKNTNSESLSKIPEIFNPLFQKQNSETNSVEDDKDQTQTIENLDDVTCDISSDKDDFVSQMPDIGEHLPHLVENLHNTVPNITQTGDKKLEHSTKRRRNTSNDLVATGHLPIKQGKFQEPKVLPVASRRRTRSMTADSSSDQESLQNMQSPIRRSRRISNRSRTSSESSENSVRNRKKNVKIKTIKSTAMDGKQKLPHFDKLPPTKSIHLPKPKKGQIAKLKPKAENLNVSSMVPPIESNTTDDSMIPDSEIPNLNDLIDEFLDAPLSSDDDHDAKVSLSRMKKVSIRHSRVNKIFEETIIDICGAISPFPASPIVEDKILEDIQVMESESQEEMGLDIVISEVDDMIGLKNATTNDATVSNKGRNSISPSTDLCTALSFGTPKHDQIKVTKTLPDEDKIHNKSDELEMESDLPHSNLDNLSTSSNEDLLPNDIPSTSTDFTFTSVSVANDILKPRRFSCEAPEKAVTVLPIKPAVKSVSIDIVQSSFAVSKNNDLRKTLSLPLRREGSGIPSHWHASLPPNKIDQSSEELSSNDHLEINTDNETENNQPISSNQENYSDKENMEENVETPSDFDADTWLSKMSNVMSPIITTIDSEADACSDKALKKQKQMENIRHEIEETIEDVGGEEKNDTVTGDPTYYEPNYPPTEDECDLIMDVSDGEEKQKRLKNSNKTDISGKSDSELDSKQQMDENDNNVVVQQPTHDDEQIKNEDVSEPCNISSNIDMENVESISQKESLAKAFEPGNLSENHEKSQKIAVIKAMPKQKNTLNDDTLSKNKKLKKVKSKKKQISDTPKNKSKSSKLATGNTSESNVVSDSVDVTDPASGSNLYSWLQKAKPNIIQSIVTDSVSPADRNHSEKIKVNEDKENRSSTGNRRSIIKLKPFKRKKTQNQSSDATIQSPDSLIRVSEKLTIRNLQDVNTLILKHKGNENVDVRFEDYFLPRCIARFLGHSKQEFDIFTKLDGNDNDRLSIDDLTILEREFVCQMHLIQNTGIYEGSFIAKLVLPCILRIFKTFGYGSPIPFDADSRNDDYLYSELQHLIPPKDKNKSLPLVQSCALVRVFGMLCKISNSLSSLCSLCCYCLKWQKYNVLIPLFQALLCWPDAFKSYPNFGKSVHRILRLQVEKKNIIGNRVKAKSMALQLDWLNRQCDWETGTPSTTSPINQESLLDAISRIKSAKFSKEFETFLVCEANNVEELSLPIPVFDPDTMIGVYIFELLPKEGNVEKFKQDVLDSQFWPLLNSWSQHLHIHGNTEEGKQVSDTAVIALLCALSKIFSFYMMRQRHVHKDQPTTPQLQTHFKVICSLMEHLSTMYFHKAPRLVQCATAAFLIRTAFCNPLSAYQSLLTWVKASTTTEATKRHKNTALLITMSSCDEQTVKNICIWLDSKCGSLGDGLVSRLWMG